MSIKKHMNASEMTRTTIYVPKRTLQQARELNVNISETVREYLVSLIDEEYKQQMLTTGEAA